MKKVLIATGMLPPRTGGPATYSKTLLQELPSYGLDVEAVSFDSYLQLPKGLSHILYMWKLFLRSLNADYIYAQDPVSVGLPAALVSFVTCKPLYLKVVGDFAWEQGSQRFGVNDTLDEFVFNNHSYGLNVGLLKYIERFVAWRARKIIVPSEYLKKIITGWGVPDDKITVIYNAVEVTPPAYYALPANLQDKTLLLSVGRMVPWKGFGMLIEMMKELPENCALLLAGDGPEYASLRSKASGLLAAGRVYFTGSISRAEVRSLMKQSTLFLLNSSYEGFSHVLLESLYEGLPVVASNAGGNPELIDEEVGRLCQYNDITDWISTVKDLLGHEEQLLLMSQTAISKSRHFSVEEMITGLITVLES